MKTQETKPSSLETELTSLAGQDATLARMLKMNRPLTLETYLKMEYPGRGVTLDQLGAEERSMIPGPLLPSSEAQGETEQDGIRAEAIRREQVRRLVKGGGSPGTR